MDALLNLEAVTSHSNFKSLRYILDQIESHIRSLKSLGIPSESYGSLLSSMLMSKLPQELRLIVSRTISDGEWNFEEVMAVIEKEIDARERAGATFVTTARNHVTKDLPILQPYLVVIHLLYAVLTVDSHTHQSHARQ